MKFKLPLIAPIKFGLMTKKLPTEGNLAWEYNPFRNYRLSSPKYYFRNRYFSKEELEKELDIEITDNLKDWSSFRALGKIRPYEEDPIFYDNLQLVDFDTDELQFDINHPVDILPQYSYDGSVNLILNDGKNKPRLINSRFSALGKNKYKIVNRRGNNDTNIYDQGGQFESDTSLYKTYVGIPELHFLNVLLGGQLGVGNYHFYFKYVDADGNETDFVAESGLVSIFKGSQPNTINSGYRNENSHKSVHFNLSNIDPAYQNIKVYYTVSSADVHLNPSVNAYRIELNYLVSSTLNCAINITGLEKVTEIPISEINLQYQIAHNVLTLVSCQNMLFLGNIQDRSLNYRELADLSLRFTLHPNTDVNYTPLDKNYTNSIKNTYQDPKFIYNFTGYQNREIYRFGIVYLMTDGTLSPVFNVRGMYFINKDLAYTNFPIYNKTTTAIGKDKITNSERNYITYNEETGYVYKNDVTQSSEWLENVYGIIRVESGVLDETSKVIGIEVKVDQGTDENLYSELEKYGVKGYFFVRQKRIPLRLAQGYSLGIDSEAHTPLLYVNPNLNISDTLRQKDDHYIAERFINDDKKLTHNIQERLYAILKSEVKLYGAICPDYDVDSPLLNTLFCGDEYLIEPITKSIPAKLDLLESRHFYVDPTTSSYLSNPIPIKTRILGVEDNVRLVEINNSLFSARAGEAEEAFRYEHITSKIKNTESTNLLRGSFGPYLALKGFDVPGVLFNVYIKDYKDLNPQLLFNLRSADKSSYYAVSERFDIKDAPQNLVLYRGDSYICTFTHRIQRNFQDPSVPTNSVIVDEDCWKNNYVVTKGVLDVTKFSGVNLGDVNAVKIGTWITFSLVSNHNLNIRSLDESHVDEAALNGHPRTFYPYSGMSADGSYKIPESLVYNKAFDKTLSERINFEPSDVPAIKGDFTNRISYSDIYVNDAFKNGFRTFRGTHYRDYPKTYGQIVKLVEMGGNLLCVFEHGIAIIPVNERAVAATGDGGNAFINTSNVLPENPRIVTDTYGSQWKESIIKTNHAIYGVDTVAKVIWKFQGDSFHIISDMSVLEFLNNNISLSEREVTPVMGIRNVKAHYNSFKGDIMFTFYDNLYDYEERAWNLCYNELIQKWVTFYSWIPSYSDNIDNIHFSFDRETTKAIAKLGVSKSGSSFSDGVVLSENIIPNDAKAGYLIGDLSLANRSLPTGDNIQVSIDYFLERDPFNHYKNFEIKGNKLYLKVGATEICSEKYIKGIKNGPLYEDKIISLPSLKAEWIEKCVLKSSYVTSKDEYGKRKELPEPYNIDAIVSLLRIRAQISILLKGTSTLAESYTNSFNNLTKVDAGYYKSLVAVAPKYNLLLLTTDFWKHGLAGIFDITEKVQPAFWYGKQHPFELEFIANYLLDTLKVLDCLEIISNNAEPESFHYEIVGDSYSFAKDKKNMYIRQEATKLLLQENGTNIIFDRDYPKLKEEQRKLESGLNDKSTLFPLYYSRQNKINTIEDYYHLKDGTPTKDYSRLSGSEIKHYPKFKEFRVVSHSKAMDINKVGRLRGNMGYIEDKWRVQVNPITFGEKNESDWPNNKIPIILDTTLIPDEVYHVASLNGGNIAVPEGRKVVQWNWTENNLKETSIRGKWFKIRIRYTGNKLAVIAGINTLYTNSFA